MNVLVYSGTGATTESVKHCLESLRLHLSPHYAVVTIGELAMLNDPWMYKTALLVVPGGADLPYCNVLNGEGTRKISQYVRKGGKYLGLCAGGYFGSSRCEFEVGNPKMEVSGPRELALFPGTCKGCAYKGFHYEGHDGAYAAKLDSKISDTPIYNYYNGGGVFLNASLYRNVEVLATYDTDIDVDDPERAAVVHCTVGKGAAVLCGTHPEFSPAVMKRDKNDLKYTEVVETLAQHDHTKKLFLQAVLAKLGLKVNDNVEQAAPKLTPIYLSSHLNGNVVNLMVDNLKHNLDFVNGNTLEDVNDTFVFHDETENDYDYFLHHGDHDDAIDDDPNAAIKHIKVFSHGNLPESKVTPYFNMSSYFGHLERLFNGHPGEFGLVLGYGEVVTSTNTLLDKNPKWLRHLPNGFTLTATTQVAGRGRGGNVWINPKGVMAASVLFKIPSSPQSTPTVVTLQYLCGLALIEAILGYGSTEPGSGSGYEDLPVRLKWPNDIYILKSEFFGELSDKNDTSRTTEGDDHRYAKVSGAIINSQFLDGTFHLVWGGGVNVSNSAPTTSLNIVLDKMNELRALRGLAPLAPYQHEILLAKFMHTLDTFYSVFKHKGLTPFLPLYYKRWFHLDQRVTVDTEGGRRRTCVIKGITPDYGLLIAHDVDNNEVLELQPDGNSFDIFKGLVYRKR